MAERREVGRLERETGVEERKFKQLSIKGTQYTLNSVGRSVSKSLTSGGYTLVMLMKSL